MMQRVLASAMVIGLALTAPALAETTTGSWSMQTVTGKTIMDTRWTDATGSHESENNRSINLADYGLSDIGSRNGHVTFKVHREAGDFSYEGWLTNGSGGGNYSFAPNDAYFGELSRRGYDVSEMNRKIECANLDVTMAFVNSIERAHVADLTTRSLIELKAVGVEPDYITALRSAGLDGLNARELVEMRSVGVTPGYVADLARYGYTRLRTREYVEMKSMGIDAGYIAKLASRGYAHLTVRQIVEYKSMGIE
jgi:hypothetical protein